MRISINFHIKVLFTIGGFPLTKKVLVVTEVKDQELRQVSFEALAVGQKIADGGEVVGVLLGESIDSLTDSLFHYGADRVVTVNEANITLSPIWVRKWPKKKAEEIALGLLERVGIPEQATKYPGQLSGGQQQRVAMMVMLDSLK